MTDPNTHINYTAADIERYLNGGMNAREMHDMEKTALQDPFLADAIEGYSEGSMEQSHKHLNEITALLQKDNTQAKVVTMPAKSFQWWRVAAMIIVVAGVGGFSWYLLGLNKPALNSNEVAAAKQDAAMPKSDSSVALAAPDTATLIAQNNGTVAQGHKAKRLSKAKPQPTEASAQVMITESETYADKSLPNTQPESLSTALAGRVSGLDVQWKADTLYKKDDASKTLKLSEIASNNIALNNFSGFVKDNNNQPVSNALINIGKQRAVITNNQGYFNVFSPDSSLQVSVSSVGYLAANANLSRGLANNIIIQPDQQALSDVVVMGYAAKRKQADNKAIADTSFPAGGWQSFQEYIYRKLNKEFDSTNSAYVEVHGNVEIEFSINDNGDPYNFKVVKSMGKENDDKAISAIKDGPRWITSRRNKKGKVVIRL